MTKSFSFAKQLKVGDEGINLLVPRLRALGHRVEDLTKAKNYQDRDVDLLVDGVAVEVKSDTHSSEKLFLELSCGEKPGCVFKSRADYWAYAFPKEGMYYWIPLPELQWWVATHMGQYKPIVIRSHRNKSRWLAVGIAVPVAELAQDITVLRYEL